MLIIQLRVEDKATSDQSLEREAVRGHTLRLSTLLSTSYALFTCEHAVSACLLGFHTEQRCMRTRRNCSFALSFSASDTFGGSLSGCVASALRLYALRTARHISHTAQMR